jgi:hypothetical protein
MGYKYLYIQAFTNFTPNASTAPTTNPARSQCNQRKIEFPSEHQTRKMPTRLLFSLQSMSSLSHSPKTCGCTARCLVRENTYPSGTSPRISVRPGRSPVPHASSGVGPCLVALTLTSSRVYQNSMNDTLS